MTIPNKHTTVSIIIPAYNEEECIAETLQAIRKFPPHNHYEVLVVDNGSTDRTSNLVEAAEAHLISHPEGTIASVRNRGVTEARGEILVFLDADILVTAQWAKSMPLVIDELIKQPLLVTGSRCLPPNNGNWFNRHWFTRLASYDAPYINSGHLVTTRILFDKIEGFSEHLKTAEDYDFCMKAKAIGASIKSNPDLAVIHLGYPHTIGSFVKRERWHGREDFETFSSFLKSKVGWGAAFNLALFILTVITSATTSSLAPLGGYFVIMYLASIILTMYKFKPKDGGSLLPTAIIFYIYLCGRSLALVDRFVKPPKT